jgi:hypothetical protein
VKEIFYKMPIKVPSTTDQLKIPLLDYDPFNRTVTVGTSKAGQVTFKLSSVRFEDGSLLEWAPVEIDRELTLPTKAIPESLLKEKEDVYSLNEYLERRGSHYERYPQDMLKEDGTPNWKTEDFFHHDPKSTSGALVRCLIEDWLTYEELEVAAKVLCTKLKAKFNAGKFRRILASIVCGDRALCPPGLGKLVASDKKLHILYDPLWAKLEHEKFCCVRCPWGKFFVGTNGREWRKMVPATLESTNKRSKK